MKKQIRRLSLHRETVRSLQENRLLHVAGGSDHTYCVTDCPWCPTDEYSAVSYCYQCPTTYCTACGAC